MGHGAERIGLIMEREGKSFNIKNENLMSSKFHLALNSAATSTGGNDGKIQISGFKDLAIRNRDCQ